MYYCNASQASCFRWKMLLFVFLGCNFLLFPQKGNPESELLNKLKNAAADTSKVKILIQLSEQAENTDPDKALRYANEALSVARKSGHALKIIDAKLRFGHVIMFQGDYPKAEKIFIETLDSSKRNNYRQGIKFSLNRMGVALRNQGKFDEAVSHYLKSLKLSEEDKDSTGIAKLLSSIGVVYYKKNNLDIAIDYYNKSLAVHRKIGSAPSSIAATLNNLAGAYMGKNDYVNTKKIMLETFALKKADNDLQGLQAGYDNYARLMIEMKDLREAGVYAAKSMEMARALNDDGALSGSYDIAADVLVMEGKYREALPLMEKAAALYKKMNARDDLKSVYYDMAVSYEKTGNYKAALQYHTLFTKLKDSIFNERSEKVIAEMNAQYETEKKTQENLLLSEKNKAGELTMKAQQDELKMGRIILIISLSAVAVFLVLLILTLRLYNQKKKDNQVIQMQKQELQAQKDVVDEKQKEILDSIYYARKIQRTLITSEKYIEKNLKKLNHRD